MGEKPMTYKTIDEAVANLNSMIGMIPERYGAGVDKADWLTPASSDQAEANWGAAVRDAATKKKRQLAIKALSNEDWKKPAKEKGMARIGEGVRLGLDKYRANFGEIYSKVLADVQKLPPKTVDFRTNVQNRLLKTVESWKKHSGNL